MCLLNWAKRPVKKMSKKLFDLIRYTLFLVKKTKLSANMTLKSGKNDRILTELQNLPYITKGVLPHRRNKTPF